MSERSIDQDMEGEFSVWCCTYCIADTFWMSVCEAHTWLRPLGMCTREAHILEALHVK